MLIILRVIVSGLPHCKYKSDAEGGQFRTETPSLNQTSVLCSKEQTQKVSSDVGSKAAISFYFVIRKATYSNKCDQHKRSTIRFCTLVSWFSAFRRTCFYLKLSHFNLQGSMLFCCSDFPLSLELAFIWIYAVLFSSCESESFRSSMIARSALWMEPLITNEIKKVPLCISLLPNENSALSLPL